MALVLFYLLVALACLVVLGALRAPSAEAAVTSPPAVGRRG
jgi:hypothetical protein